jgi:hypothetical protein
VISVISVLQIGRQPKSGSMRGQNRGVRSTAFALPDWPFRSCARSGTGRGENGTTGRVRGVRGCDRSPTVVAPAHQPEPGGQRPVAESGLQELGHEEERAQRRAAQNISRGVSISCRLVRRSA